MNPYVASLLVGFVPALLIQDARAILLPLLFWLLYAVFGWVGLGVLVGLMFFVIVFDV